MNEPIGRCGSRARALWHSWGRFNKSGGVHRRIRLAAILAALAGLSHAPVWAGTVTWDKGGGTFDWSTGSNWSGTPDNTEPTLADDAIFTTSGAGSLVLSAGEEANSLSFNSGTYTLGSGDLTLGTSGQGSAGTISVANGLTATINSTLAGASGLTKTSAGTLKLGGANPITGGITINAGTINAAASTVLGNNPITINSSGTLDLTVNGGANDIREFSGAGTFNKFYSRLTVNALNDAEFSGGGTVSNAFFAGFVKTGPGTQTVTGCSWFIGAGTTDDNSRTFLIYRGGWTFGGALGALSRVVPDIVNGTLTIDESSADINRVPDTSAIRIKGGGGTLRYKGGSAVANPSELLGNLDALAGAGGGSTIAPKGSTVGVALTVSVQRNGSDTATLSFNDCLITSAPGWNSSDAIVNFTAGSGDTLGVNAFVMFRGTATLRDNVLPGGFVNGTDIATYDATKGVVPFNAVGGAAPAYVAAASADATDTAYVNGNYSLPGAKTWNALKIDGSPMIDLNGNNLTIGSANLGLMIVATGGGEAVISNTGTAGRYLQAKNDFAFYIDAGQTLKITAPLKNTDSYFRVNKAGPGLLWLAPTENWAGTVGTDYGPGIRFSEGAIRMNPDLGGVGTAGRFQNQRMALNGGVMELDNMPAAYNPTIGTAAGNLRWQSSGGFAAYGTDATFQPNITWNATDHIPDGAALLLNSTTADGKITLSGTLNLGTTATAMYLREIEVADNTGASTDLAEISGQIVSENAGTPTYGYHLVKTGAGTLVLKHANNNYSGATYVKAGTLLVNGTLAAPASSAVAINPDYTAVTAINGGTLGGTGTINRNVRFEAGSAMVVNPAVAQQLTVTGAVTLNGSPKIVVAGTLKEYTYTLLTATSVSGTFDPDSVPARYAIRYTATTVELSEKVTVISFK